VDVRGKFPEGRRYRERLKPPVTTYSAVMRWGEQRERAILAAGGTHCLAPAHTLDEFWPRFIEGHARANQEKPSTIATRERIWTKHLASLGALRLDEIGPACSLRRGHEAAHELATQVAGRRCRTSRRPTAGRPDPHLASHVRVSPRRAERPDHPEAGGARVARDDTALHAPVELGAAGGHPRSRAWHRAGTRAGRGEEDERGRVVEA
jgi:hypothetical protein